MKLTDTQSKKVQMLRGVAIIAVVFIHNTPIGLAQVFLRPFLNFSVGLFLFFSGMLSSATQWNPRKRITKVVIPYILWSLIYTVIYNVISNPIEIPIKFLKNVLMGNASAIMYYIFVYCEFTLIIPFIDRLAKSKYRYWGFVITPLEIVIMRFIPVVIGRDMNSYISIIMSISCLGWFTYFYLGYMIGNKYISVKRTFNKNFILWVISIVFQIVEGYFYYMRGYQNCGTQLKITSIISGVLFALMAYSYVVNGKDRNITILKLLGDNSFGIYFSHLAVMAVISQIPVYVQYIPYPITAVVTIVFTTICVLVGKKILGDFSKYLAL